MADFQLTARPAAGDAAPFSHRLGDAQLVENTNIALASIAARRGQSSAVATQLNAPGPGRFSEEGATPSFWLGPNQWMVWAPHDSDERLAARLKQQFGDTASVTEQNDAWCVLDLTGPELRPSLERLTLLDVWAMPAGAATRTMIDHIGCFLLCREVGRSYRLIAPRSFGRALATHIAATLQSSAALAARPQP